MHSPEPLIQLYLALFHKEKVAPAPPNSRSLPSRRQQRYHRGGRSAFILPQLPTRQEKSTLELSKDGLALLSASTALIMMTAIPPPAPAADLFAGSELFKANCSGCHLGGANFIKEKKTLKKEALEKFQSLDQEKLQAFVETKMPHKMLPFHAEFSEDNFRDVTSYVLDQALEDKW